MNYGHVASHDDTCNDDSCIRTHIIWGPKVYKTAKQEPRSCTTGPVIIEVDLSRSSLVGSASCIQVTRRAHLCLRYFHAWLFRGSRAPGVACARGARHILLMGCAWFAGLSVGKAAKPFYSVGCYGDHVWGESEVGSPGQGAPGDGLGTRCADGIG